MLQRSSTAILIGAFALLSWRLLALIDANAVNVLYWDQWDLYDAFMQEAGTWELFRWQHGPHRQGVGFLLTRVVADLSGWNTRVESLVIGVLVCLAAALFLLLQLRLHRRLDAADVVIPLVVLSPAQYGIFIHTCNASHSAAPLALLSLYCLSLTVHDRTMRYGLLLVLNFLLIYTGFGVFVGLLTVVLLLSDGLRAIRSQAPEPLTPSVVAAILALLSAGSFFLGYTPDSSVPDFEFPSPQAISYPRYMALMLANVCGVKGTGLVPSLVGFGVLFLCLLILGQRAASLLRGPCEAIDRVILVLAGFGLLFCLNAAIGRISLGLSSAQATRYVPLVVPIFLAIHLQIRSMRPNALRLGLQAFVVVSMIAATFPMRGAEASFMRHLATGKARWVETYWETHSIDAADRAARLKIYPWPPETTRLQQKLDYLEERELSFFRRRSSYSEAAAEDH